MDGFYVFNMRMRFNFFSLFFLFYFASSLSLVTPLPFDFDYVHKFSFYFIDISPAMISVIFRLFVGSNTLGVIWSALLGRSPIECEGD